MGAMAAIPYNSWLLVEAGQPGRQAFSPKPGPPYILNECTWWAQAEKAL